MTQTTEQDQRLELLNTLLTTPHRNLAETWPVHERMIESDPRFYVRLAAWYAENGDVRDHRELFIVALVLSDFPGHRDVGLSLLRALPPYQVGRVIDFIHGRKERVTTKPQRNGRRPEADTEPAPVTISIRESGLFRNVPRSVKTEVTRYLREREADPNWFDGTVLSARKTLKRLYSLLHIAPSERAQQVLFENDPPEGSRLHAFKLLRSAATPVDQARAIVEHRIPYRVVTTVLTQVTPTVLLAIIESMSPQEVINNLGSLKRKGAFDNHDLKSLVEEKLAAARTDRRVSAYKADRAADAADVSDDVRQKLREVTETQVKAKGAIRRTTALLVDKSASMHEAIELGKRIGAMISTVCEFEPIVYAFDSLPYEVTAQGTSLSDWEDAFRGLRAGGATSIGSAVAAMTRARQRVEQFVLVTDEGENTHPLFATAYEEYVAAMNVSPQVVLVQTSNANGFVERQCRSNGIACDSFRFDGDYYSLPNLIPLLSRPSRLDLLLEILAHPLPERRAA